MATEAQIAANRTNAQASSGPTTPEGKLHASQNALTHGLYSRGDFVRPDEQDQYLEFCAAFQADLAPEGAIDQTLASEIIHAASRLRRCSAIEAHLTPVGDDLLDPMLERTQQAIDRARAQAHRALYRATAELRRLQTERQFRIEFLPEDFDTTILGLASYKDIAPVLTNDVQRKLLLQKLGGNDLIQQIERQIPAPSAPQIGSVLQISRNAPCTCGSGLKFKRCCGKDAPALLHPAA